MNNLKELLISISEVKNQLSEIIRNKLTKIIVKNNEPVAVVMPFSEYVEKIEENKKLLYRVGQDITLENGVQMMVNVVKNDEGGISIKTFIKMKTSGDYKLHYTLDLCEPSIEQTLTVDEQIQRYKNK